MSTTIKQKLVYYNEQSASEQINIAERLTRPTTAFIRQYKALEVLRPIDEKSFLKDLKKHGIEPIKKEYTAFIESEISKLGLRLRSAIDNIKKDGAESFEPLEKDYNNLDQVQTEVRSTGCKITFDQLIIVDGEAELPEEIIEQIKEEHKYYFENQQEETIWNNLLALKETWDKTVAELKKLQYPVSSVYPFFDRNNFNGVVSEDFFDNTLVIRPEWFTVLVKFTREENRKNNLWLKK